MATSTPPDSIFRQSVRILRILNIYRIVLSGLLLLSFFLSPVNTRLGSHDTQLFLMSAAAYCLFSLLIAALMSLEKYALPDKRTLSALLIADILVIALITYSSGGVISGYALLTLITVGTGAMLIQGRASTLLAAIASIAIIYSEIHLTLVSSNPPRQYVQAGLLGALLFATSLYIQNLSERMRGSASLAQVQASNIVDLEAMNHLIIQRLRTGVVLLDGQDQLISYNHAARRLLNLPPITNQNADQAQRRLPDKLLSALRQWRDKPDTGAAPLQLQRSGPEIQTHFTYLNPDQPSNVLIFLEDNSDFIQRAKQMKLASLGRLTASIAHEIRNPLGAISHATQLLRESPDLGTDGQRLSDIIVSHSGRVNQIIEDVLNLTRDQDQRGDIINLKQWLQQFIASYEETHPLDGEISLRINPDDILVRFIPGQLTQVMNNLVENGLRYSKKSTGKETIQLVGGQSPHKYQGQPYLHIIDDGPGIPASHEGDLFEPFFTTESTGTGLGLYISRELCEANHARLSYQRKKAGTGKSRFSIHFSDPGSDVS